MLRNDTQGKPRDRRMCCRAEGDMGVGAGPLPAGGAL